MNAARHLFRCGAVAGLAGLVVLIEALRPVHAEEILPESFGRLFHTPAQRQQLDARPVRRTPLREAKPAAEPAPPRAVVRIDGILRRSDGRDSVWLNGELQPVPPELQLVPGQRRELVPIDAPRIRLRVGDSWPIATEEAETPIRRRNPPTAIAP